MTIQKMLRSWTFWITFLLVSTTVIYVFLKVDQLVTDYRIAKINLNMAEYRIEKYRYNFQEELFTENQKIKNIPLLNSNNDTIYIHSLLDAPRFIYRLPRSSCDACVKDDIKLLKLLAGDIGNRSLMIIADFSNSRELEVFKMIHDISVPIYNFQNNFGLSIESEDDLQEGPFMFILDTNSHIRFAYLADEDQTFDSLYLERIKCFFYNGY